MVLSLPVFLPLTEHFMAGNYKEKCRYIVLYFCNTVVIYIVTCNLLCCRIPESLCGYVLSKVSHAFCYILSFLYNVSLMLMVVSLLAQSYQIL